MGEARDVDHLPHSGAAPAGLRARGGFRDDQDMPYSEALEIRSSSGSGGARWFLGLLAFPGHCAAKPPSVFLGPRRARNRFAERGG
eukprot:930708-Pyramimonas_sp.AAC.1